MLPDRNSFYKNAIAFEFCLGFTLISLGSQAPIQYNVDANTKVQFLLREIYSRIFQYYDEDIKIKLSNY